VNHKVEPLGLNPVAPLPNISPLVTWCYCLNTSVAFCTFYPDIVLTGLLVSPGMSLLVLPWLPVISAPIYRYL
jgi:hypothetical protein